MKRLAAPLALQGCTALLAVVSPQRLLTTCPSFVSRKAIVWAFERHGFGWYHHDTMHFEYRPELSDC